MAFSLNQLWLAILLSWLYFSLNQLWLAILPSRVPFLHHLPCTSPPKLCCERIQVIGLTAGEKVRAHAKGDIRILRCKSEAAALSSSSARRSQVIWGQNFFKCINPDSPVSYSLLLYKTLPFHWNFFPGASQSYTRSSVVLAFWLQEIRVSLQTAKETFWLSQLACHCWLNTLSLSLSISKASLATVFRFHCS